MSVNQSVFADNLLIKTIIMNDPWLHKINFQNIHLEVIKISNRPIVIISGLRNKDLLKISGSINWIILFISDGVIFQLGQFEDLKMPGVQKLAVAAAICDAAAFGSGSGGRPPWPWWPCCGASPCPRHST